MQVQSLLPQTATETHHMTFRLLRSVQPVFAQLTLLLILPKFYVLQCFSISQTSPKCPSSLCRHLHPMLPRLTQLSVPDCILIGSAVSRQSSYILQCVLNAIAAINVIFKKPVVWQPTWYARTSHCFANSIPGRWFSWSKPQIDRSCQTGLHPVESSAICDLTVLAATIDVCTIAAHSFGIVTVMSAARPEVMRDCLAW